MGFLMVFILHKTTEQLTSKAQLVKCPLPEELLSLRKSNLEESHLMPLLKFQKRSKRRRKYPQRVSLWPSQSSLLSPSCSFLSLSLLLLRIASRTQFNTKVSSNPPSELIE